MEEEQQQKIKINISTNKQAQWIKSLLAKCVAKREMKFGIRNKKTKATIENGFKFRPTWAYKDELQRKHEQPLEFYPYFIDVETDNSKLTDSEKRVVEAFSKPADIETIFSHLMILMQKKPMLRGTEAEMIFTIHDYSLRLEQKKITELDLFFAIEKIMLGEKTFPTYAKFYKYAFGVALPKEEIKQQQEAVSSLMRDEE